MNAIRRFLQAVALAGTLLVGVVAVALIVSQTPWFRDWLRRYIVRESKQYLNGELSIGRLDGNLFFGVNLSDVAVDVSGQRVAAIKGLQVDYSVLDFISKGVVLDDIRLNEPQLRLVRDDSGWNVSRLVKQQEREADREGPGRPLSLESIEIADASVVIDDRTKAAYRLPDRIDDLDVKASFKYAPVHYSVEVDHVSFRGTSPQLALQKLSGAIAVRDDNLYLQNVVLRTGESTVSIDGVVEQYLSNPSLKLTTTGNVSLPEIGAIVPAASGYKLHPSFDVKADGPADRLALDFSARSESGNVRGKVTADVKAPDLEVHGEVDADRLNLAPIIKDPAQRTDLTGHATIDLKFPSGPASQPVTDRLQGSLSFAGPRVVAAGYEARAVRVNGTLNGPSISIDGRGAAYGGTASAKGVIVLPSAKRLLALDIRGRADNVNLRGLPPATRAPQLDTNLNAEEYHIAKKGTSFTGSATLKESSVEGAVLGAGTVAEFKSEAGQVSYAARGNVTNLNLQRIGRAMKIEALSKEEYDSRIAGRFDVKGSGTTLPELRLDANGALADSSVFGARIPQMTFEAHLEERALAVRADGGFEDLDLARVSARPNLAGAVTGAVNANLKVADLTAPVTPEAISADGRVTLAPSTVGDVKIDSADVEGRYSARVADLAKLQVASPDVKVDASGRLALDRESASNLKYHVEATNLAGLGKLAGQSDVAGSAVVDGTATGNASSLQMTGTLNGSRLTYGKNDALDLNSRYTATIPDLEFARAKIEATTEATFVHAAGLEINTLTATTTYAEQRLDFTTKIKEKTRELEATGDLILHPDHQEIHLPQLALRTQGIEWRTAPGSQAAIRYGGQRVELQDVRLVSGDQTLDASGAFSLNGEQPEGAIDVHARNVDLAQVERLALQNRGLSGRLTADARISGTTTTPVVSGQFQVTGGGFQTYKYDSLTAKVDYQAARVGIDATLQQSPTESITATGSIPTTLFKRSEAGHVPAKPGDEVDLHIKSTALGLGIIQGFTNQVTNVTGTMQADVHMLGSGEDPHVEGFVQISGGAFGVPASGVSYSGIDTRIELTPDVIRIPSLHITDEEGEKMDISGELAVHEREVGSVNVNIDSQNFEVIDNELGDVGVDSKLKITGELRRPRVEGEVRLESARLEVDKILALFYNPYAEHAMPEVVSAEKTVEGAGSAEEATRSALNRARQSAAPAGAEAAPAEPVAPPSAFDPVALDVRLRIPENLVLRAKNLRPGGPTGASLGDMNITVGGDVRILKDPGGLVRLEGMVDTVRGTYEFQGRRFDLQRGGTLRFTGESQINPLLDVTATREIPNTGVEARIHLTGSVKTPELQLTSNPPLDESDILSLIVFNRPINELGTGERASLATTAGGIATGFIAAPLGESIGRALDVDLFEITTTTETGELGAGVTVGQQVGDRAFFKLRQQFGNRNTSEFLIEYQLASFLRLSATAAPETSGSANRIGQRRVERAGIDLIFFFSY